MVRDLGSWILDDWLHTSPTNNPLKTGSFGRNWPDNFQMTWRSIRSLTALATLASTTKWAMLQNSVKRVTFHMVSLRDPFNICTCNVGSSSWVEITISLGYSLQWHTYYPSYIADQDGRSCEARPFKHTANLPTELTDGYSFFPLSIKLARLSTAALPYLIFSNERENLILVLV